MQAEFYDVKAREKVTTDVVAKVTYGEGGRLRYAFRAQTSDGRKLTKFVSEAAWKDADVPESE